MPLYPPLVKLNEKISIPAIKPSLQPVDDDSRFDIATVGNPACLRAERRGREPVKTERAKLTRPFVRIENGVARLPAHAEPRLRRRAATFTRGGGIGSDPVAWLREG